MQRELIFLYISIPVYIICIGAEIYFNHKYRKDSYRVTESLMSGWFSFAGILCDILVKVVALGVLGWANQHALFKPELLTNHPVAAWILVFFAQDFCFYWLHRTEHYSRFFWAIHSNHHSAEKYNFNVALIYYVLQPF
jgi:sterol desaturase/sphingolipid hydroxylase (fatty acid hydroxylase superfamily)